MAVYGTYQINFNANHGSGAPSAVSGTTVSTIMVDMQNYYTATVTLPSSKPSRNYYTFLGWSSSSTASSASYSAGGTFNVGTTSASYVTTLHAVWRRQTAYVYYNANGGSGAPATQSHNAGTTVTLSATVPTRSGYRFLGWATSSSATSAQYQPSTTQSFYTTVTLYAVWKIMVSTITASNGTMGAAQTITITKQDASYKDTVTYSFGSQSGTIASESTATSISWTPPLALASEIPNAKSASCVLTTQTYNGSTLLGSSSKTITLTIPNTMIPSASVALSDTNAVASGMGVYVQSRSALEVTVSASGQYGATITGYSTQINSNAYSTATFTTGALIASGTNNYTTVVTDSRGMQTTVTGTFTVVSYTAPTAQVPSITRDETTSSNINVSLDYIVASVNNLNAKTYTVEYKLRSASTYQTYSSGTLPDYNGTLNLVLTGFSGDADYDFIFTVADSFSAEFGAGTFEASIGSDNSLLIHSQHKAGLGFGMPSQGEKRNDYRYPVYMRQGSAVYSFSVSGSGYVKALTFGTSARASRNLLYFVDNVVQTSNGITLTTHRDGSITITGTATANTNLNLDFGNAGQATYEELDNGTTYYWSAVVLSGTITGTTPTIRGGYYGDALAQSSAHTVGANSCVSSTVPSSGTYYTRTYIHIDSGTTFNNVVIGVMMTLNNVSAYADYEPYSSMSSLAVSSPISLEYIRTSDRAPTRLSIAFTEAYALTNFSSDQTSSAYLVHTSTTTWDLYIEKDSADMLSILDMHIPWTNSDMTLDWVGTLVSVLPTGAVSATQLNTVTFESPSGVSTASGTWTTTASITLSKGIWVLTAFCQFGVNGTGIRRICLSPYQNDGTSTRNMSTDFRSPFSGYATLCRFTDIYEITSPVTYYLNANQDSGSSITVYGRIYAVRIC